MASMWICALVVLNLSLVTVAQRPYGCQTTVNTTLVQASPPVTLNSDDYTGSTGTYRPYTWCRHRITAPAGKSISLIFVDFEVESTIRCTADSVKIFDLSREGTEYALATSTICNAYPEPVVGPYCGNSTPPEYISRGNEIVLDFCADYGLELRGWRAEVKVVDPVAIEAPPPCGREVVLSSLADNVEISSPNYPENYRSLENCTWDIRTSGRYPLRIDAISFNLSPGCNDYVEVIDVVNNVTTQYCRSNSLGTVTLNSTHVQIRFRTDIWDAAPGFLIALSQVPCPTGYQACDDFEGCVSPKDQCNGVRDCRDGSDEKIEYCAPECGISHFPVHDQPALARIVGGIEANRYSVPWQAAILSQSNRQNCGATVISDRWLLSAAHCFTGGPAAALNWKARIGGHDLTLSVEEDLADEVQFETSLCHPYYRGNPTDYDYCLLKTREKIKFRKNIVPACLPRQGDDPEHGTLCLTSGWGSTGRNSKDTFESGFDAVEPLDKQVDNRAGEPLRHVIVPVANRTYCNEAYGSGRPNYITNTMICAGLEQGGRDTCQGDSGGPFMCRNRYGRYQVSGVVSWGNGCALPGYPGVYANTGAAIAWIIDTITKN